MHCPLPEVTQSTTVYIKFVPPVSGLLSLVEAQTSAMCASTPVIFALSPRCCTLTVALHWPSFAHDIDLHGIFECAHLVSGRSKASKQANIHTRVCNASHASVGLAQARPNKRKAIGMGIVSKAERQMVRWRHDPTDNKGTEEHEVQYPTVNSKHSHACRVK